MLRVLDLADAFIALQAKEIGGLKESECPDRAGPLARLCETTANSRLPSSWAEAADEVERAWTAFQRKMSVLDSYHYGSLPVSMESAAVVKQLQLF